MSDLLRALGGKFDALIQLDFETYYDKDYSLKKLTTEAYVRDPRFEVIGVSVKFGSRATVWLEEWEFRAWTQRVDWKRVALNAHHTQFDAFILSHHYGIKPGFLLDTMSMARACVGPIGVGLEILGPKFGVGEKGHEADNTKGKRRKDFTHAAWLRFGDYANNDVNLTARLLEKMLVCFPIPELWLIDTTIRCFTEPVFTADLAILQEAAADERTKKAAMLARIGQDREVLTSKPKFATLLRSMGIEPETKPGKKGPQYSFAKTDPFFKSLLEHEREDVRMIAEARLGASSNIIETRADRVAGAASRGRVPFYLKFCGAHTHRWAGGDKMNPQNFNRGGALRRSIVAAPGEIICVADSGQIEARQVAWFAGEQSVLAIFRRNDAKTHVYKTAFGQAVADLGRAPSKAEAKEIDKELTASGIEDGDFYSDVGGTFFGKKLSKKETPIERQVSKSMVLGLGFGMGVFKFSGELLKGMLGADPVQFTAADVARYNVDVEAFAGRSYGRDVTCADEVRGMIRNGVRVPYNALLTHAAVADHFVRAYRGTNKRIAATWKACDKVIQVMAEPGPVGEVRGKFGCLTIIREGLVKPGGLTLHYPGLRRKGNDWTYIGGKSGREHVKIYGGLLTENIVQSLARDVLGEQALWIRADGYPIGTTTHDEVVAVPREALGVQCLKDMIRRMRVAPDWCRDMPLNAEGGFAHSYADAK